MRPLFRIFIFLFLILLLISAVFFLDAVFVLRTPPVVKNVFPRPNAVGASLSSTLLIEFNKPIKRQEVQVLIYPSIHPVENLTSKVVHGQWEFKDPLINNHFFRTLFFTPAINLEPDTKYQVKLSNITGFGLGKSSVFAFSFKTQLKEDITEPELKTRVVDRQITLLNVPQDWQDDALSCEAACLKMALFGKGIFISEKEIMEKIGQDLTPRKQDIWGDAYETYIGGINGKMCKTGYGVYWTATAEAANKWRPAQAFSGWKINDLTQAINSGHPVIVWGVLPTGSLTDCSWFTPGGKYIRAFKETHVRLVVGFIGHENQPSQIILNDPLSGRIYWSTDYFLQNWKVFSNSGVIVR